MDSLSALETFFELAINERAFIAPQGIDKILAVPPKNLRILVGPKGMGKTALLDHIKKETERQNIPSLKLNPSDIELDNIGSSASTAEHRRALLYALARAVAEHIGQ